MKVLWLTNVILPKVSEKLNTEPSCFGGWLIGYSNELLKNDDFELVSLCAFNEFKKGSVDNISYYAFDTNSKNQKNEQYFKSVLEKEKPDVIHIFGTENKYSGLMIRVCEECGCLDRTVVSIQGLVSVIARHYYSFLPQRVINGFTFRDIIRRDNVALAQKDFAKRGKTEIVTIKKAKNIIGRTDWDEACIKQINPAINYNLCNESLRDSFYDKKWSLDKCEKHSIFVSQASYPIKGFHLMLEGFKIIADKYPDAKLYTTGKSPLNIKLKQSCYSRYLCKLIRKYGLEDRIEFLGFLNEREMADRMLKSHVFVSPSTIENSPNSVGEAMLLGVPTVSSDVGGVKNMLTHEKEGFLYPADEPYMIEYYASKIFEDHNLAKEFSESAIERARITHNREINGKALLNIYSRISQEKK